MDNAPLGAIRRGTETNLAIYQSTLSLHLDHTPSMLNLPEVWLGLFT
jgi:hypothetical protein